MLEAPIREWDAVASAREGRAAARASEETRPTAARARRPRLIVFSGLDGAGKSTQIALLSEHLKTSSIPPVYFWSRGGYTPLFSLLKRCLRTLGVLPPAGNGRRRERALGRSWVRRAWLAASILDLMLYWGIVLRWWALRGKTVICDRYVTDTLIDYRLNYPEEPVEKSRLWRWLTRIAPRPDLSVLLLVPVGESVRRSALKGEPFSDPPERLAERLTQYQQEASHQRWIVLDGRRSVHELSSVIRRAHDALA